ncbi:glycosyltransferase involved in cell wall biosynthesis [Yoonia maricola]|uniref:Glycosyltransferase involved in cell wall biosynthesis n=1 Tax=Yoonia maricola TaxID=420999 RepID=A0A2M8W2G1_9RHOB|nr:glycosyltransferase [Yoonia maricola]PJI85111.1 glycosyltransferase involved in cell wall biosynthesis [Yoonia maricola]
MKVLHVVPTFYPATYWGGPIWSTKAICDGIAALEDVELRVLTSDAAGPAIHDRVVPANLPYPVHYARRFAGHCIAPGLLAHLPAAIGWADIVHVTGTYNMPTLPAFVLARALGKPVVWSPRGALQATEDWADAPNLAMKRGFEHIAHVLRPCNAVLHVTAAQEARHSLRRLGAMAHVVIPNAVDVPAHVPDRRPDGRVHRLMFLSRLHPKKGLEALFDAMAHLPAMFTLDIYGTGDASYVRMLKTRARLSNGRIRLHGHVEGAAKAAAFAKADIFVLPSHSENFGIVVAEALAHAVPVLTTQTTPWQDLDRYACGRCIDLPRCDLAAEIMAIAAGDLADMGQRGRAWMRRDFSTAAMVDGFEALYRGLVARKRQEAAA